MQRRQWLATAGAVAVAGRCGSASGQVLNWLNGAKLGQRLPEHDLQYLKLEPEDVWRVCLIDFWATWCAPCRDEIPVLNQLRQRHGPRGLVVVGISQEARATVEAFLVRVRMDYAVAVAGERSLQRQLRVRAIPFAVAIDRQQTVIWRGTASDLAEATVEQWLA